MTKQKRIDRSLSHDEAREVGWDEWARQMVKNLGSRNGQELSPVEILAEIKSAYEYGWQMGLCFAVMSKLVPEAICPVETKHN